MATGAEIQAALADAREFDLEFADLAVLLKRAITNAIVASATSIELPWQSAASRNTSITRLSLQQATEMMLTFQRLAGGGVVGQFSEFREPR